jgi:hypothetical protein
MPAHAVEFRTPALDVPKLDVLFRVKQGKHAFGRLYLQGRCRVDAKKR